MPKRFGFTDSLLFQGAFLLLSLSVFGWGLQARLSEYHSHGRVSAVVAKMSADKRASPNTTETSRREKPKAEFEQSAIRFVFATGEPSVSFPTELQQAKLNLLKPSRFDDYKASLMLRPPPANS